MNKPLKHIVIVLLGAFTLLFVQLNRVQWYGAEALREHPANGREAARDFGRPRGDILTRDGQLVAESVATDDATITIQRSYPEGELYAHIAGFYARSFGAEGVEKAFNDELVGRTDQQAADGFIDLLSAENPYGDIILTLDHGMQTAARDLLGARDGSVVALDPVSGEVYAMWSRPSFDPNELSTSDTTAANEARSALLEAEGNPLLARTYRERFPPGSTFKIVTSASALENGVATLNQPEFERVNSYTAPLTERPLTNFDGSTCGGNLVELLVVSCNTAFAQLAAEQLGPGPMIRSAKQFGFNDPLPFDLEGGAASNFPTEFGDQVRPPTNELPAGVFENTPALAQTAIGQNDVSATPLQMALVAAGVSNGGAMPTPHVVSKVLDHKSQREVISYSPGAWRPAIDKETSQLLTTAMIEVAERGSASGAATDGLVVGAKTGTAQVGTDPPRSHAWIIAFAGRPGGAPELAVAVLVEGQEGSIDQTGGAEAAPIARGLFEQFFE